METYSSHSGHNKQYILFDFPNNIILWELCFEPEGESLDPLKYRLQFPSTLLKKFIFFSNVQAVSLMTIGLFIKVS